MTLWRAMLARRQYFYVALGILALDQVTKILAHRHLRGRSALEVIPDCFSLWYSRNPGGLFGYFRELGSPWRTLLLTLMPALAIVLIAVFLGKSEPSDRPTLLGLGLILGGAVGNLIDRLFRGEVIDFLDVYIPPSGLADWLVKTFGTAHWPTFNVADSAIVVGACLLLLRIVIPHRATGSADGRAAV